MKVKVKDKEVKVIYPCLGRYPNGIIVLFTSKSTGVCLEVGLGCSHVGKYSDSWQDCWTPFEGTLELSND